MYWPGGGGGGGGAFFFAAQLVAFHPETLYMCDIFAHWLVTVLNTTHTQQSSAFVCFTFTKLYYVSASFSFMAFINTYMLNICG